MPTTLLDSKKNEIFAATGAPGVPFFVAVDKNGNVVTRTVGNISAEGFAQLLEAAESGKVPASGISRSAVK